MAIYDKVVPVAICVACSCTSFLLGVIYGQVPYTVPTLFHQAVKNDFTESLLHYQRWSELSIKVTGIMYSVGIIGLLALIVLLYKPKETLKLYDWTSLGVYFLSLCVFLTNIRTGIQACIYGNWGEVDEDTGLNVIAASQIIAAVLLFGVLFIQAGRFYQIIEDEKSDAAYQKLLAQEKEKEKHTAVKEAEEQEKKDKKKERNAKKYGHVKED